TRIEQGIACAGYLDWSHIAGSPVWLAKIWRNNLACLTLFKAKSMDCEINLHGEEQLERRPGPLGIEVNKILPEKVFTKTYYHLFKLGIVYIEQLLEEDEKTLLTWPQIKLLQAGSKKGRKASWFKFLEERLIIDPSTCQIDTSYYTRTLNNLASRLVLNRLQEDNRHKEGIYFKTKNSSIELGKVLKKGGNRILVEHWISAKAQNHMTRTVSKCKGCALNTLKASPNCVSRIYKHNIIGVFPSSEKLSEAGHLLISPEMFERSGIKSKEAGCMESILQELEIVEELEVEIVKNRTKNLDVASDLID
ncbi:20553_t:CDS:1, partial [Gigaspora margarita]